MERITWAFWESMFLLEPLALKLLVTVLRAQTMAPSGLEGKPFALWNHAIFANILTGFQNLLGITFFKRIQKATNLTGSENLLGIHIQQLPQFSN